MYLDRHACICILHIVICIQIYEYIHVEVYVDGHTYADIVVCVHADAYTLKSSYMHTNMHVHTKRERAAANAYLDLHFLCAEQVRDFFVFSNHGVTLSARPDVYVVRVYISTFASMYFIHECMRCLYVCIYMDIYVRVQFTYTYTYIYI
jgi:hypothetical protein